MQQLTSVVNPLANPKGVKLLCELCKKPAHTLCENCRVTYYCGHEHKELDKDGIHDKICSTIKFIKTKVVFLPSEEERRLFEETMHNKKLEVIEVSRTIGQKFLFEGRYQQAIPAAMQALKMAIEVYSLGSVELVPSYLILGEASIGTGDLKQAEEYLTQAEWTVLKGECPANIKYKLFRIMGMLRAARGENQDALEMFADDIYHASLAFSPEDIHTSGGYFHMASVFLSMNEVETANSLVKKVTSIWFEYLTRLTLFRLSDPKTFVSELPRREDPPSLAEEGLDEAQQAEALKVLSSIIEARKSILRDDEQLVDTLFSLAMLHFAVADFEKATRHCQEGLALVVTLNDYPPAKVDQMQRLHHELTTNPTFISVSSR